MILIQTGWPFRLTVSLPVPGGAVSLSGTTVTFTPTANYTGAASFTYTIINSEGLVSAPATVSVTVNAPAAPIANNVSGIVASENTPVAIAASTLLAHDTDPDGLAISLNSVTAGSGGTASLSGTTVTFTPTTNYTGPASFTYTIKNTEVWLAPRLRFPSRSTLPPRLLPTMSAVSSRPRIHRSRLRLALCWPMTAIRAG